MLGGALMAAAGAATPSTLLNGLVNWWNLDTSGVDSVGSHPATSYGTPSVSFTGTGALFASTNGLQVLNPSSAMHPTAAFSVTAWLNSATAWSSMTDRRILSDWHLNAAIDRWIFYVTGGALLWYVCSLNEAHTKTISFGTPTLNTWHHFVGTADGAGTKAYFNGVLVGSQSWTGSVTFNGHNSGANISMGKQDDSGALGFEGGKIRRVGLYNRALTPSEITELYNGGAGKAYPF